MIRMPIGVETVGTSIVGIVASIHFDLEVEVVPL